MEILLLRTSSLGDIIHCLPAAQLIKDTIPGVRITWMVKNAGAPLLVNNPAVDEVIVLPRRDSGHVVSSIMWVRSELSKHRFAAAINFQPAWPAAVLSFMSGAPRRFGFRIGHNSRKTGAKLSEAPLFITDRLDVGDYLNYSTHVVDLNYRLALYAIEQLGFAAVSHLDTGDVYFPLPEPPIAERRRIDSLIDDNFGSFSSRFAVLIPGTTWVSKIWPAQHWGELGQILHEAESLPIVIIGGSDEQRVNDTIETIIRERTGGAPRLLNLTGDTNLLELIALFSRARIVIGGDTGPLHLAAAVNKPKVLGVYGSTPVGRNGAYGSLARSLSLELPCQPCFETRCPLKTLACLKDLTADRVYDELKTFVPL